jgi:hypothetical protein
MDESKSQFLSSNPVTGIQVDVPLEQPVKNINYVNGAKKAWATRRLKQQQALNIPHKFLPNPIDQSPGTKSAYKAHDTMRARKDGLLPHEVKQPVTYDRPGKNKFRDIVVGYFENNTGSVLALESEEMVFVNALPQHRFILYEHNSEVYNKIFNKVKSGNSAGNIVYLENSDIANAKSVDYDYAFLDFCSTFTTNETRLKVLARLLINAKYIALTFSLHDKRKKEFDKRQIDLVKRLQAIFLNHTFETYMAYADRNEGIRGGSPMVGIVLKNRKFIMGLDPSVS